MYKATENVFLHMWFQFLLFCTFKGDLSCKNHFYKVFEHRFVASVCENNQLVMVKMHQLII